MICEQERKWKELTETDPEIKRQWTQQTSISKSYYEYTKELLKNKHYMKEKLTTFIYFF